MTNPLQKLHEQAEAEFQSYGDVEIVSTFGEPQAEYAAIRKGCALLDLPQRAFLQASGPDRIEFLNRFLTNQLMATAKAPIPAGAGAYAFLLNVKGRIVADLNALQREDTTLLETDARNIPAIQTVLEKHVFSEKVRFENLLGKSHQLALLGPTAGEVVEQLFAVAPPMSPLASIAFESDGIAGVVYRDDPCGVPGYFLQFPVEAAAKLWMRIITAFPANTPGKRTVRPIGWAVFNSTRIEAGRPLFGIDFDDTILPAETSQLDRAVSFTKGCYLGQEIVARMHARNQVARKIVGIKMLDDALPLAGAPILDDAQNQIGGITSSTISPVLSGAAICLGLIKSASAAVGTQIRMPAEGAIRKATVAELPFVKSAPTGET